MKAKINFAINFLLICSGSISGKELTVPDQYQTIQEAVDAARTSDKIVIADGTYKGEGNTEIDLKGKAITLYSENGPNNCVIDCQGSMSSPRRAFIINKRENKKTIIDGFTIINGYADKGGAISIRVSSPVITNCVFINNTAVREGGAIYCNTSSATIKGCILQNNRIRWGGHGGGISLMGFSGVITDCDIEGNEAESGGGLYIGSGSEKPAQLTLCDIFANSAELGGGIGISGTQVYVTDCTIAGNSGVMGAGIHCNNAAANDSSVRFDRCLISGNSSKVGAGGVRCCIGAKPCFINCIISGNLKTGIHCDVNSAPSVVNCTIAENTYAGLLSCGGAPEVSNSIFWNNENNIIAREHPNSDKRPEITYCNILDSTFAGGNITSQPLFFMRGPGAVTGTWSTKGRYNQETNRTILTDNKSSYIKDELAGMLIQINSENSKQCFITGNTEHIIEVASDQSGYAKPGVEYRFVDYHLQKTSLCIDRANTEYAPKLDFSKNERDNSPDIGAFEFISDY